MRGLDGEERLAMTKRRTFGGGEEWSVVARGKAVGSGEALNVWW